MLSSSRGRAASVAALACGALIASCFTGSDGLTPHSHDLYFPTAVVVSPGRTALYVVNSDFDLQFNGGTVQALNLIRDGEQPGLRELAERIAASIDGGDDPGTVCGKIGVGLNTNPTLYPGTCDPIDVEPFIRAFATVGAFGSGATLLPRDDGKPGARLFVSVRGDPSVTYFDVADDRNATPADPTLDATPCDGPFCLECAGEGEELRCSRENRIGENIFTSQRGLLLPTEPTSLASAPGRAGDPLVVAHQTSATVSLVVNSWPSGDTAEVPFSDTPSLEFLLEELPEAPTFVASIPRPKFVDVSGIEYRPGFVVTHRAINSLSVVRFFDDVGAAPPRPFLVRSDDVPLSLSGDNTDSRGLAFDTTDRDACEALCDDDDLDCAEGCLSEKVGFYVASRSPASLLVGSLEVTPTIGEDGVTSLTEKISLDTSIPVPLGPAVTAVGKVIGPTGELETRVFVVCFDSRFVVVYDPRLRTVETLIRTGRGPFGVAFDTGPDESGVLRSYLYVTHFTDSYVSVFDLDTRRITYATPLLNIGPPVAPREEQ